MVKFTRMKIQKLILKYLTLLLIYILLVRFIKPYGLNLYYSFYASPDLLRESFQTIQSFMITATFFLNFVLVIFILNDSKNKKGIDWLIVSITFFSAETGVIIFLIWQVFKNLEKKYEAQQHV